jgi:purine-binding chemotaxis protein CheW
MSNSQQLCTFFLKGRMFAFPVQDVQEVIRCQPMTRVPLMPPSVRGLINLRGQIVMAVDLRRRLGIEEGSAGESPMNVVVRTGDEAVSFLVDEIGDVLEVDPGTLESPPETLAGPVRELVQAVCKLEGSLLLVLNTKAASWDRMDALGRFKAGPGNREPTIT